MSSSPHPWWRNCAIEADAEIQAIDQMENQIAPIAPNILKIRELISGFELCHHKAERWVRNIIEAIGTDKTEKGLGTRFPGQIHSAEKIWQSACAALSAWCAGSPSASVEWIIGSLPANRLLNSLGERSSLKEWQVHRVIKKIRSCIHWPKAADDPDAQYAWLLLSGGEYESAYRNQCPERYREHEDSWLTTVRTLIHDIENGEPAELSLGLAIDMLWPCHWRFVENLQIVLGAIGGNLHPQKPFAACGRNIGLFPRRKRMENLSSALRTFCGEIPPEKEVDRQLLALLGEPTASRKWLAASLDKTIRLQMDPPDELRVLSALSGPDWIKK